MTPYPKPRRTFPSHVVNLALALLTELRPGVAGDGILDDARRVILADALEELGLPLMASRCRDPRMYIGYSLEILANRTVGIPLNRSTSTHWHELRRYLYGE